MVGNRPYMTRPQQVFVEIASATKDNRDVRLRARVITQMGVHLAGSFIDLRTCSITLGETGIWRVSMRAKHS